MTQKERLLTAIDVGTSKVCTIISRIRGPKSIEVLAHSVVPSEGLRKGNVAQVVVAAKAIRASLKEVEEKSGVRVESAYVGVAGAHVSFENRWDQMDWAGQGGVITAGDLGRIPDAVSAGTDDGAGRQVIHAIPMAYKVDGQKGIRNPIGMHTRQLEVETHVVTGGSSFIDKLVAAVANTGVRVDGLVLEPLASGEAALTPKERVEGAAIVDIGGGTTDLVIFKNGTMFYTAVIPVGGYQFTNDICVAYNTPYPAAERIKLSYAHTEPFGARPHGEDEEIAVEVVGRKAKLKVLRRDLCQLTRERAMELIHLLRLKLNDAQIGDVSKLRLVLVGGTSKLPGLEDLVRQTLTNGVRTGVPNGLPNMPEELNSPAFATSVGILLWAAKQDPATVNHAVGPTLAGYMQRGPASVISRFLKQVRGLLPGYTFLTRQRRV